MPIVSLDDSRKSRTSREPSTLGNLAKRINAAYSAAKAAAQSTIQHTVRAGGLLVAAKGQVPHGQWAGWIRENTSIAPRTASAYMRVAEYWASASKAERQRVADLPLRAALEKLASPRGRASEPDRQSTEPTVYVAETSHLGNEAEERIKARAVMQPNEVEEQGTAQIVMQPEVEAGRAYRSYGDVMSNADLRHAVVSAAKRDLDAWKARYRELKEVCELIEPARKRLSEMASDA